MVSRTDQDEITKYRLFELQGDRLREQAEAIETKLAKLEIAWVQTHDCSCMLVGIRCPHVSEDEYRVENSDI